MADLELTYLKINESSPYVIAFLTLNRAKFANALSFDMMKGLPRLLDEIKENKLCRVLVLRAKGKHFSAGADLAWMKASKSMTEEENKKEALILRRMFEELYNFPKPTIAVVRGAAYGGATGLLASCDSVICSHGAKFCFSEVNLGLGPAVIFPYLSRRIRGGDLKRLALTGAVFSGSFAKDIGLVNFCTGEEDLLKTLKSELSLYLSSAPEAISEIKKLHDKVLAGSGNMGDETATLIARLRRGEEAQHGLSSFFEKKKPSWSLDLNDDWKCDV